MRPHKLRIEGFTCFNESLEIDFTEMDVFVIAGPTGSGKSTLIDAICYALYGRTPRSSGTSELISPGRDVMRVQFEFGVGTEKYRVHRGVNVLVRQKREGGTSRNRVNSPVQFERMVDGEWEPAEDRVKGMDQAIQAIIGLDFDGFTRCVLLPQGKFQEFLSGDKKARRDILMDLLQLHVFGRVQQAANRRAGELTTVADGLERRLREDYLDATVDHLAEIQAELEALGPRQAELVIDQERLTEGRQLLDRWVDARRRQADFEKKAKDKADELEEARLIAEEGGTLLKQAQDAIAEHEAELDGISYDAERVGIVRLALSKVNDLSRAIKDRDDAEASAADTSALIDATSAAEEASRQHEVSLAACESAESELEQARKDDAAGYLRRGLKKGDPCPVCGEALSAAPEEVHGHVAEAERALQQAKSAEKKALDLVARANQALAREQERQRNVAALLEGAVARVAALEADVAAVLPPDLPADAKALQAAIDTLESARRRHQELMSQLDRVRTEERALSAKVTEARQRLAGGEGTIELLQAEFESARDEARTHSEAFRTMASASDWPTVIDLIEAGKNPREEVDRLARAAADEALQLGTRRGQLERDSERIARAIETAGALTEELQTTRAGAGTARVLGGLLRADKFQEYVLDESLVTLAEAASKHLETLHDRFSIEVEKGEFMIIDHWQADNKRPATTLSGGETFVASLALALALSEKLPEIQSSAATRLESLFLDEGFGTLDPEKLDTVIQALEGLRSQERVVGIITHVQDLASRIANRIDVESSPAGSRVLVNGVRV